MIVQEKAVDIEPLFEIHLTNDKYDDSLILAVYLELTSPQSATMGRILKQNSIPFVPQLSEGQKSNPATYWKKIGEICMFVNSVSEGNLLAIVGFMLKNRMLRQTNFKCIQT